MPETSTSQLVLIPSYNTGDLVLRTVREALQAWAPVWVVVDGSDDGSGAKLEAMARGEPNLRVLHHDRNQGKGSAVLTGLVQADAEGFTAMLVMDADGQHPADRIARFMEVAAARPGAMVLGLPIFDDSAPAERLFGRKIANFLTDVETLWGGIGDCLFGFRVYPVKPLLAVMRRCCFARRFDFDPEVAMRLVWRGVPVVNIPCPCRYLEADEGGVSHFNYLRDNLLLAWMYHRLMAGMLLRLPLLLPRRLAAKQLPRTVEG